MSDGLDIFVGITVTLLMVVGAFVGTIALLATINSMWGLLVFLTWPFIAAAIIMFVLWWGDR